uniref:Protein CPR-5 n=1 Tax=Kalanchoe fedtschenkoi TaxID=63787 RepID=A0A7N0ZSQ5_KALFE
MEIEASSSSSFFQPCGTPSKLQPTLPPLITPLTGTNGFSADSDLRDRYANSNSESVDDRGAGERKRSFLKMRKRMKVLANGVHLPTTSASSVMRVRGMGVRRSPRNELGSNSRRASEVEALALPLGMSIAAVFAQVLDKREEADESEYIDDLSEVCVSAVKEALRNVFGDKHDCFVGNFEKSFRSTLRTIRLINGSSVTKGRHYQSREKMLGARDTSETGPTSCDSVTTRITQQRSKEDHEYETVHSSDESEDLRNITRDMRNVKLDLDQNIRQDLICIGPTRTSSAIDSSVVSTFKKSVVEQTRANDLKAYEISLLMEKLKLKETKLALDSESNYLDRFKLSMGLSRASFKAEKFKTQLEDTRHAELLRSCIDCLVGSLLITSGSLVYGAYVHSYKRISEATASCASSTTSKSGWKSWLVPEAFDTFRSGFQMVSCQVQVLSRMLFGVLMILAITYLLLQRSAAPHQSMPITFILLILGIACGFSGKLCVDTLGGDGYIWLLYWEAMCVIHFFANVFTSSLFTLLYGPITFNLRIRNSTVFSYLSRRVIFYAITLFILPLTCGLIPFASTDEWKDHFLSLAIIS